MIDSFAIRHSPVGFWHVRHSNFVTLQSQQHGEAEGGVLIVVNDQDSES